VAAAEKAREVTLARFAAKMKNRLAYSIFTSWTFAASEWKRERVVLARCALKIQRRLERSMLDSWKEFASERLEAKALLIRILNRMIHAYTGKGFHHWCNQLRAAKLAEVRGDMWSELCSRSRGAVCNPCIPTQLRLKLRLPLPPQMSGMLVLQRSTNLSLRRCHACVCKSCCSVRFVDTCCPLHSVC